MNAMKDSNSLVELVKTGKGKYKADLYENMTKVQTVGQDGAVSVSYQADCYRTAEAKSFDSEEEALAYYEENFDTEIVIAKSYEEELTADQKKATAQWLFDKTDYRYNKAIREKTIDVTIREWLENKYPGFMDATKRWTRIINGETDLPL